MANLPPGQHNCQIDEDSPREMLLAAIANEAQNREAARQEARSKSALWTDDYLRDDIDQTLAQLRDFPHDLKNHHLLKLHWDLQRSTAGFRLLSMFLRRGGDA